MKTTRKHRNLDEAKREFRVLFDAQHILERCENHSNLQVQMIILLMDQMLQEMLDSVDDFE